MRCLRIGRRKPGYIVAKLAPVEQGAWRQSLFDPSV